MPDVYTTERGEAVLAGVAKGLSLRAICRELKLDAPSVRKWVYADTEGFGQQYARTRDLQYDSWADEIMDDATDEEQDVQRSRLIVDTKKWLLAKLNHKRYGDRVQQEVTGADGGPLVVTWQGTQPKI